MNYKEYFNTGMSYDKYWDLFSKLALEGKSNSGDNNESLAAYTRLNWQRSKRVHKKVKLSLEMKHFLESEKANIFNLIVITEPWCGDASQILPIISEIEKYTKRINLRLLLRDQNKPLMKDFLTNGTESIPIVIILDENFNLIDKWGPRPEPAQKMLIDFKKKENADKNTFYLDLQSWYNTDNSNTIQLELLKILKEFKPKWAK